VRIRPYKTTSQKIDGAVLALVDIDAMKRSAQLMLDGRTMAGALINAVRNPALLLDGDLNVHVANEPFYRTFRVSANDTLNRRIYDLGNKQWDIPKLRTLLEDILPQNSNLVDFVVQHAFPELGVKKMVLDAHRIDVGNDKTRMILLTINDVTGKSAK